MNQDWENVFLSAHGRPPTDADRQDQLFSLIFLGSGQGGAWTDDDWACYIDRRSDLWDGSVDWPPEPLRAGYDRFHLHVERLSGCYGNGRDAATQFTRAAGLIWGGIAYEGSPFMALFRAGVGRHLPQLHEGPAGWRAEFIDDDNPAHHWVAAFVAGYYYGAFLGTLANSVRDLAQLVTGQGGTLADIRLGNVAAGQGAKVRRDSRGKSEGSSPYERLLEDLRHELSVSD